jgi:sulfate adenylyltransferase subunit 1
MSTCVHPDGVDDRPLTETLLRVATAGSVDDGKSTLIGRLLHDSRAILDDQLSALAKASATRAGGELDLALLTDGLRAEREQGITIDVAYRYVNTGRRRFVLADTPGHTQYTRNMVTGSSVSDAAVVLVDARSGLVDQSRRHLAIAALLQVRHVLVAVNKMDLVDWDESRFEVVAKEVSDHLESLPWKVGYSVLPVSALVGTNVVSSDDVPSWWSGPTLLAALEDLDVAPTPAAGSRLAVQWVVHARGHADDDHRGYAGRVWGAPLAVGDEVTVWPSKQRTRVSGLFLGNRQLEVAELGQAVAVQLADHVDAARGVVIASGAAPKLSSSVVADVNWFSDRPVGEGDRLLVKHLATTVQAFVEKVEHRLDIVSGQVDESVSELFMNDLGRVHLDLAQPIAYDPYDIDRVGGRAIAISDTSNTTVGALLLR